MRRNWRGRYRNNWYRSRNNQNNSSDNQSLNNSTNSHRVTSTAGSSRAPANQIPTVIPINEATNIWKLYFPTKGSETTIIKNTQINIPGIIKL